MSAGICCLLVGALLASVLLPPTSSLEPHLCDSKHMYQCDAFATCCLYKDGQHGCCPFTAATCCPDRDACCPPGFFCQPDGCSRNENR